MHYFLTYGRQLTQEEMEQLEEDEKAVKKQYPSLDQFREQGGDSTESKLLEVTRKPG